MYHFNNYSSAAFSTLTLVCAHHHHPSTPLWSSFPLPGPKLCPHQTRTTHPSTSCASGFEDSRDLL